MILFKRLWGNAKKLDGGTQIEKVIEYALSTQGGAYSALETLDTAQETTRCRVYWPWKQYHQPIVVSNIDVAKNGGESAVFKLVAADTASAMNAFKDRFADDLYTAQSGKKIHSLVDMTDDATNVDTYADVSRGSYSWWKGQYNGTGGALSLSMLATQYDLCQSGNDKPTLLATTNTIWSAYEGLLQPQVRYNFNTQGYPKIDGGFTALYYRDTPMVTDEKCTSGYLYFLNEKYIDLVYMSHPDFPTDKMGFAVSPMRVPTDQDGKIAYIFSYLNLICTKPKRQGVIRSVS